MPTSSEGTSSGRLRAAGLAAVAVGVVGSVAFLLRAGQRTPPLLLLAMGLWVLSPFIVLTFANVASRHWPAHTRTTLYYLMLVVTAGSLAVYAYDAVRPRLSQPAFLYVAVPPASWLLIGIGLSVAALVSRRLSRFES
jgi:hypothetical protein